MRIPRYVCLWLAALVVGSPVRSDAAQDVFGRDYLDLVRRYATADRVSAIDALLAHVASAAEHAA